MNIVLVSTYELGHQPFGLASPQAWLTRAGHNVTAVDLAVAPLPEAALREADRIAFYLPMHTATRLALPVIEDAKRLNPQARLACYGLYAPINADLLRGLGVEAIAGGEFESALVRWTADETIPEVSLDRQSFPVPSRADLPPLNLYAKLRHGADSKLIAYTEASRGCKHLCRHCPVVPVYQGKFRVVGRDTVLADLRQQIAAGAQHVTFGDPDFFNGPKHALDIVEALHAEFPQITYDATIKIEHLLKHRDLLKPLRDTGCLFLVSAVESVDDRVLAKLEKNHTRRDFIEAAAATREAGIALQPTFIAFSPWTTIESYREMLRVLRELDLVENVAPVQLALRLLITANSRLLELDEIKSVVGPFDAEALVYPWRHPDPEIESLAKRTFQLVAGLQKQNHTRAEIFAALWNLVGNEPLPANFTQLPRTMVPFTDEPWYCCAEPIPV
ncbi:MAG TPA: CUAEP/CCAEP-tail radical SAM protein [Bryobacteraceae bacterium]|jgi:radical SAM superfamily enzyme YgiQ (UPF0313 family)